MMDTTRLISNRQELMQFLNALAKKSFFDKTSRPDTKWRVVNISNTAFYVNHVKGAPVDLPIYIKNNHGLRKVNAKSNLCFFHCLAVHQGANLRK